MNTATTPSAVGVNTSIQSADRLGFTVFLAVVVHAMVIFGLSFTLPDPDQLAPTLEITLATHQSDQAPDEADFLAQHNQEASGTETDAKELSAEQLADFAAPDVRDINPAPEVKATTPAVAQQDTLVTSISQSPRQVEITKQDPQEAEEMREGEREDSPLFSTEIASLQAKLDRQRQEYAKRPRIRRLTSVATRSAADAAYLHQWSTKIEQVGNLNYPEEALRQRLTGHLQMAVTLNPNGTIRQLQITEPSGIRILDEAAVQIVRMASPFDPFPAEIRKDTDQLVIIRTWSFEIDGLSTGASRQSLQ
ncbi:MAG TPA: energy transducer TonB [Cellvibrionaceae bacterium]